MEIQVYNYDGVYQGKAVLPKGGGWVGGIPWTHLARGVAYKFKFVNTGGGTIVLKQGFLEYTLG
ncbi:hypothetical protein [Bacillus sp. 165]|uniref:hypothetical protein n=1 Tax=Bacillus sp. 165 TaxID=1529117 RepID=UPI001ADCFC28|nr:hypothetical protein [Bacillus sp. 165]MBO9129450.1 hypothetical protein [Bacillus sp. 165]